MDNREALRGTDYRIAVLSGGDSSERAVSLVSGKAVCKAVGELGIPCRLFELETNVLPAALDPAVHLVLPLIHGTYGEDGRLSAALAGGGFAYGGCDHAASALCFDKLACKAVAEKAGLRGAPDATLHPDRPAGFRELSARFEGPFILKPRRDGSSVGLHRVQTEDQFEAAGPDLAKTEYLAEAFHEGIDLTVGILGNEALGVVAVYPEGGLYDYRHKYTSGLTRYEAPADIGDDIRERLFRESMEIYHLCGCRDLARVDFRLGSDGVPLFLEINTIPGMTPTSLLPKAAACAGISFTGLIDRWIGFVLHRKMEEDESA